MSFPPAVDTATTVESSPLSSSMSTEFSGQPPAVFMQAPHPPVPLTEPPSYDTQASPTSPAPAYDDEHQDDLIRSLALPSSLPAYEQRHSQRTTPLAMEELPNYVVLDQFEPPWSLPSDNSIKYTVLAHHGIDNEGHMSLTSPNSSLPANGTFLHEVIVRPSPPPRPTSPNLEATNISDDDDYLEGEQSAPPVIYHRTSPWALEYWCEDTIMYLYFPVKSTPENAGRESGVPTHTRSLPRPGRRSGQEQPAQEPQQQGQGQMHRHEHGGLQEQGQHQHQQQHEQVIVEQAQNEVPTGDEDREVALSAHVADGISQSVPTASLRRDHDTQGHLPATVIDMPLDRPSTTELPPPSTTTSVETDRVLSSSDSSPSSPPPPANRHHDDHTLNATSIPTFALVAANDPVSSLWISRVDDKLVERSIQRSLRDEAVMAWRVRGAGTGDESIVNLLQKGGEYEIMARIRGQRYAWRDVTREKLVGTEGGERGGAARRVPQGGVGMGTETASPSLYQPHTMSSQPHSSRAEAEGIELAETGQVSASPQAPSSQSTRTPSNARMFALIRDDHFVLDTKMKGYCVAEVWVVHEEEHETRAATLSTSTPHAPAGNDTQFLDNFSRTSREVTSTAALAATTNDSFPDHLRRRKCMIRIKQGVHHDIETFILTTGPRLPDLFDKDPEQDSKPKGRGVIYAYLVMTILMIWGVYYLSKERIF